MAMQRQYNVGLRAVAAPPGTISQTVDKHRYPKLGPRGPPERAWPATGNELRSRRLEYANPPPRYTSAFTTDVSHLVV